MAHRRRDRRHGNTAPHEPLHDRFPPGTWTDTTPIITAVALHGRALVPVSTAIERALDSSASFGLTFSSTVDAITAVQTDFFFTVVEA